jgi:excinuclease UvrABC ATPase subunit
MSNQSEIIIKGAKTHNLKNLDVNIPKNQVVVFTGVSGSGKSSLVFDTIYTEAQRQLIETFSSFARVRLPKLTRPEIEEIQNISTAIIIDQKRMGTNLRSTIGTVTELYTYLRLLFSRCGDVFIGPSFLFGFNHPLGMCPDCKGLGKRIKVDVDLLLDLEKTIREGAINHPDFKVEGWNWREMVGIQLFPVDKKIKDFSEKERNDLLYAEGIQIEKVHGAGTYSKNFEGIAHKLERYYINKAQDELPEERQDAYDKYFVYADCTSCNGSRINERARSVKVCGKTIPDLIDLELTDLFTYLQQVKEAYTEMSAPIITKMLQILTNMINIGIGYLSLSRPVATLSGGESQRVKMAKQLGCDLINLMYILDEPSIGLHPKDLQKIIEIMRKLRDKGNSVFVVEHDPDVILHADYIIDIGPRAGTHGGEIVYSGPITGLKGTHGLTAEYLYKEIPINPSPKAWTRAIEIKNASLHNLKNISTRIPEGIFTCLTGVAGSGKSSLIEVFLRNQPDAIVIDQSSIGKSSRSNPATYLGVFDYIRKEFAKATHSNASLFSFNSAGACPKCKGLGTISYEMAFMDEVKVECDECQGKRFTDEVLELQYNGKNIHEILSMTIEQVKKVFKSSEIQHRLQVLCDVGLEYLQLGQPLSTLSGGECQRIKLATELQKTANIYVMDEPTTGLHRFDVEKLLLIIQKLTSQNNTVVVIEHNLDVIKQADWIIDLGPAGGFKGGEILFEGTPHECLKDNKSITGQYLKGSY